VKSRFSPGLALRLAMGFASVSAVLLLVFGWFASQVAERTLKDELGAKLISVARLAAEGEPVVRLPYAIRDGAAVAMARRYLAQLATGVGIANIIIVDRDENVLADARGRFGFKDKAWLLRLDRAELKRVWLGSVAASQVYRGEDGGLYLSAYAPLMIEGKIRAVAAAEASAAYLMNISRMRRLFFVWSLILLLVTGLLGWLVAGTITRPVRKLREAVERVESGEFTATAAIRATHEVGDLGRAFNRMAQAINVRHEWMLESMSNGLVAVDMSGNVTAVNRAAEDYLAVRRDSLLGRHFKDRLPPELSRIMEDSLSGRDLAQGDKMTMAAGGENRVFQVISTVLRAPDGDMRGAEVSFLDVTEIERLTSALEVQQRFAAIGEMAAAVAHEIRNPLATIQMFAELLRREMGREGKAGEYLEELLKAVVTVDGITGNFLMYARPLRLSLSRTGINDTVREVCRVIGPEFERAGIDLVTEFAPGIPDVRLDAGVVQQAMMNLLRNALEACEKGGWVAVGTSPAGVVGEGVCVTIEDNGSGIPPEVLPKLFVPFTTTKAKGTGLGLSLAKKFVEAHGGTVSIESLGKGTRARIVLPSEPQAV